MRISDWSSDVCSSDLAAETVLHRPQHAILVAALALEIENGVDHVLQHARACDLSVLGDMADQHQRRARFLGIADQLLSGGAHLRHGARRAFRSEEHTSELQSLMRISYAVFCLKQKTQPKLLRLRQKY